MKDSILYPYSAIFFGVVLAVMGGLPITAAMNVHAKGQCQDNAQSKLIHVTGFWGDIYHCVDRRYL